MAKSLAGSGVMFRKINAVFRPNHGQQRSRSRDDYHNASTVRLVRSTSMLVVGESRVTQRDSTLKRSVSAVSLETSTALFYYQSREDRVWLYSQNQSCLEYLQDLVALRRQYTRSMTDLKNRERKESVTGKKKPAPKPPQHKVSQTSRPEPSAPPAPSEEDTLQFFDAVIASCDPEPTRKPFIDDGHADVDFIVATSTCEHDLHSNWVLRNPRRIPSDEHPLSHSAVNGDMVFRHRGDNASTGSRRWLQRNPIHLPKVVESAFHTLRLKPRFRKKD
ncbi:uncharacterized protein C13orf42 [Chanos chanos]|uniref:Uncharacterized protein C13orf42 n=1 Tax=Chanos chanos TaxID=29144 RepID=A0A6J2WGC7_CHACN|nr:uncharacterized protein C13orf42 homolog [Chanos chanos]